MISPIFIFQLLLLFLFVTVRGLRWQTCFGNVGKRLQKISQSAIYSSSFSALGPSEASGLRSEDRISRYSPEKRRLRPGANLAIIPSIPLKTASPHTTVKYNRRERIQYQRSKASGNASVLQPEKLATRKSAYRSSYEISSILMLARQKGDADLIVDRLANLQKHSGLSNKSSAVKLKEYNLLLKELGDNGHLDQCDKVLALMQSSGAHPNIITYSTLISKAAIWQKVDLAEMYFQNMMSSGISPDVTAYNCLLNAYAKVGQSDKAFELMRVMDNNDMIPNLITFNTLVDSCAHSGDVSKARSVFDMMKQRGIAPNARTYSSLIHTCCQAKAPDQALQLLQRMKEENFEPTDVTLSLLVHGLGQGGDLQRAFEVLESMKSRGLKPNVVTLSSLVYSCGKHGQLDRAFSLYKEMDVDNDFSQKPNSITCSSLIDACLKCGDVDRAFTVVKDMRIRKLPLTQVTYTSLITELTKLRRLDRILEVIQGGIEPTVIPADKGNVPFMDTELREATQDGKWEESELPRAVELFASYLEFSSFPEHLTEFKNVQRKAAVLADGFHALEKCLLSHDNCLRSSAEQSAIQGALHSAAYLGTAETAEFLQKILDIPGGSNINESLFEDICRFLLYECGRACRLLRLQQTVKSLGCDICLTSPWNPSAISAINELVRDQTNSYDNIVEAYQWIKDNNKTPCARIYNQLLRSVNEKSLQNVEGEDAQWLQSKQLRQDELFRLFLVFQEMRVSGVNIDAATYNTLINACAAAGNLDKAIETVRAMQEEGVLPNVITYTSLIKACRYNAASGTVQLAEFYFLEMQQKNNHFSKYIEPTTYTYLQLMKTHLKAVEGNPHGEGETSRVWDLLEDLLKRGLKPTIHVWRECVVAALLESDIQKALGILVVIREQLGIDAKTWQACIDFCASHKVHEVDEMRLRAELSSRNR